MQNWNDSKRKYGTAINWKIVMKIRKTLTERKMLRLRTKALRALNTQSEIKIDWFALAFRMIDFDQTIYWNNEMSSLPLTFAAMSVTFKMIAFQSALLKKYRNYFQCFANYLVFCVRFFLVMNRMRMQFSDYNHISIRTYIFF